MKILGNFALTPAQKIDDTKLQVKFTLAPKDKETKNSF